MIFSKRLVAFVSVYSSFLAAEETLSPDQELPATKEKSQFFYVAGGINPLPTFSLGYRKLYSSFGSDLSISVSAVPALAAHSGTIAAPGAVYKQLFFTRKHCEGGQPRRSSFYWGLDVGVYPLGAVTVNGGGLVGWQYKRKSRSDFFEIGINPFLYSKGSEFRILPIPSLTYAFMF